ncbi:MAG TPA: rRNA adenine methyltransferase [Bacteroidales bacterium]|nr:rRNA adenine methyltransferase [Bacteroidales bacterium]
MVANEGYIKFYLSWEKKAFDFKDHDFHQINLCRDKLYKLDLIEAYLDGVGYGNLSIRYHNNEFIISGSATGNYNMLSKEQYALVREFDLDKNSVRCDGLIEASSESLSHAAIYKANKSVNAVIHIHHKRMWEKYVNILPTTPQNAEFGTPEIAYEIAKLIVRDSGIIIMEGHPEGIISYGKSLIEAETILMNYYNKI